MTANSDFIFPQIPQQEETIKYYKQTLPINIHHFYIIDKIEGVSPFIEMINVLKTAEVHDTVYIYLNTSGGDINTTIQIISAMKNSQATIITVLEGEACSAGTIIFLSADKFLVNENCSFMIHNYSQFSGGKGHELFTHVNFTKEYFSKLFRSVYSGFLTEAEIMQIEDGKDIWMGSDEVIERLKDLAEYKEKELEEQDTETESTQEAIEKAEEKLEDIIDSDPENTVE